MKTLYAGEVPPYFAHQAFHYGRFFWLFGDRKLSLWSYQNYQYHTYMRQNLIWLNKGTKIKGQNKKLWYIEIFCSPNVQSRIHDVKNFSLKENEIRNNSRHSLEILVWITEEIQQIPNYTSFLKLFKDNNTIFKICRNSSFTAASLVFHNTNVKKFSEAYHKFISNMPLTQGLLSYSLRLT